MFLAGLLQFTRNRRHAIFRGGPELCLALRGIREIPFHGGKIVAQRTQHCRLVFECLVRGDEGFLFFQRRLHRSRVFLAGLLQFIRNRRYAIFRGGPELCLALRRIREIPFHGGKIVAQRTQHCRFVFECLARGDERFLFLLRILQGRGVLLAELVQLLHGLLGFRLGLLQFGIHRIR